jgi:N-acetylglucosaminyl-diphospho-decaprenol L-rhamnosyltransferase
LSDVSIIIVSYNAREHLARSLASVAGGPHELIVVDNASTDGSPELVRGRFPSARLVELPENRGFGAGNNEGMRIASGRYFLLLNSDAWPVGNAIKTLVGCADNDPTVGVAGPRIVGLDGNVQASVRGFPTVWRLATEYFFLRKLAPRSRTFNAFYGSGFDYKTAREAEFLMGAVLLLRREAVEEVGDFDEGFFMFSEETDLCYRMHEAGWKVEFFPAAEFIHVGGASTKPEWGRMYREQLRGHLLFLTKHHGAADAERARRMLVRALQVRGVLFRGERGRTYRQAAEWLGSAPAATLLESRG